MDAVVKRGAAAIIRPARAEYDPSKMPTTLKLNRYGDVHRIPVEFKNARGQKLVGSLYKGSKTQGQKPFVVIYLHGNSQSQMEGRNIVSLFVPVGISVFSFDFSGSGRSDGKYISLGWFERDDITAAMEHLRSKFNYYKCAIWGRSMGAAAGLLALPDHPDVPSAVLDSPFASLPEVITGLADHYGLPGCLTSSVMRSLRDEVMNQAGFDIMNVIPIKTASDVYSPVFLIHGNKDDVIEVGHSARIFNAIAQDVKELRIVDGDHYSNRPDSVILEATKFICSSLGVDVVFG